MGEYIKREDALEITTRTCGDYAAAWAEIRKLPTADVAPVVHGRWEGYIHSRYCGVDEYGEPVYRDVVVYYCSDPKCRRKTVIKEKYCPNCGADMREVNHEQSCVDKH